MRFLSILAIAAPLVAAIEFTGPSANSTVTKGSEYELTWTTVDTDPTNFGVYLVNFVTWPPSYVQVAANVETAHGSASIHIPCDTDNSYGYQFNAVNGTNTYVIYAQSPKFSVGGHPCVDEHEPAPTCAQGTTTIYVTVSPSGTAVHPEPTSYGTVPNTIGWCSGYSHPVTLTEVPVPGHPTPAPPAPTPAPYHQEPVTVKHYVTTTVAGDDCGCIPH